MGQETTIRLKREGGFTVLPNSLLRDRRLSLKTKGLFCMMLSLPGNWEYNISGLISICGAGRDAIRGALRELEDAGYLEREREHGENGQFSGMSYTLHETSSMPQTDFPSVDESQNAPLTDFPSSEKPTSDKPSSEKPTSDKPSSENPPLQNKDYINTPYSPPEGDGAPAVKKKRSKRKREPLKEAPDWKPERFAGFWNYYPRGEDKQSAIREWDKLQPSDELIDEMAKALQRQMTSEDWQHGVGIPYAVRWLRNQRWKDEKIRVAGGEAPPDEPLRGEGVEYL